MEDQQGISSEIREKEHTVAKRRDGGGWNVGLSEGQPTRTFSQQEPQKLASKATGRPGYL